MGMSVSGILVYGYDLGGSEDEWLVTEVNEYGNLTVPWYPDEDSEEYEDFEVESALEQMLFTAHGFLETDWHAEGFFDRQQAAKQEIGVEFSIHGTSDYSSCMLVAYEIREYAGKAARIDFTALEDQRVREAWDEKLAAALRVVGLTPTQDGPQWLLSAYYG